MWLCIVAARSQAPSRPLKWFRQGARHIGLVIRRRGHGESRRGSCGTNVVPSGSHTVLEEAMADLPVHRVKRQHIAGWKLHNEARFSGEDFEGVYLSQVFRVCMNWSKNRTFETAPWSDREIFQGQSI